MSNAAGVHAGGFERVIGEARAFANAAHGREQSGNGDRKSASRRAVGERRNEPADAAQNLRPPDPVVIAAKAAARDGAAAARVLLVLGSRRNVGAETNMVAEARASVLSAWQTRKIAANLSRSVLTIW